MMPWLPETLEPVTLHWGDDTLPPHGDPPASGHSVAAGGRFEGIFCNVNVEECITARGQ